jgi:hypothetical protein
MSIQETLKNNGWELSPVEPVYYKQGWDAYLKNNGKNICFSNDYYGRHTFPIEGIDIAEVERKLGINKQNLDKAILGSKLLNRGKFDGGKVAFKKFEIYKELN